MKIARFEVGGKQSYGIVEGDSVKAIKGLPWDSLETTGDQYPLSGVKLLSPVQQPPDIFAIGLNYRAHADESGIKYPAAPVIFIKASSSISGPGDDIVLPATAPEEVDYEAELALIIGRTCSKVSEADALKYAFGYTCGDDVSARDCQIKLDVQWARGKSFDTFCPIGPWIETDLDPDNQAVSLKLNGEVLQSSNTKDLIFNCSQLISYLSHVATMQPGTVIMTGTPSGVGFARKPPIYLKAGDTVEVTLDGVGTLSNKVVQGS